MKTEFARRCRGRGRAWIVFCDRAEVVNWLPHMRHCYGIQVAVILPGSCGPHPSELPVSWWLGPGIPVDLDEDAVDREGKRAVSERQSDNLPGPRPSTGRDHDSMSDSRIPTVALCLTLLCGLAAASVWFWRSRNQAPTPPVPASAPTSQGGSDSKRKVAASTPSSGQGVGVLPVAKVTTIDVSRSIRMPDGKYLPALNGVLNPPALTWPTGRPYSPVVGTERDTRGDEWYVHADGSKSTMTMIQMNRQGRMSDEPVSYVATPQANLPVLDESKDPKRKLETPLEIKR